MFPKRLDRITIYESDYINLYTDKVLMPSGKVIDKYHQLDYPRDAVVALLVNSDDEICFIKSLRYTTQKIEWELPAGGIEKGEDILVAAKREVIEETGFETKHLKQLYSYYPSNGMSNQQVHVIFGEVEDKIQKDFDTDEVTEVHWLSSSVVKQLLEANEITDGVSLIPLLTYMNR